MREFIRQMVYAVLYGLACVGLVYCCASCFWRLGSVPSGSVAMFVVLVLFGAYGAYLCGQSSIEIFMGALARNDDEIGGGAPEDEWNPEALDGSS
tara:strand:- start:240 stop:524 length:285 start_codon:yes stop_codon:yes gene_type:complete